MIVRSRSLAQLSELELFENFCRRKNDRVENSSHGEGATDDCANCRQKVIERRPSFVILHGDWIQVVSATYKNCHELQYSGCSKTGHPVWQTGHKSVRISACPVIGRPVDNNLSGFQTYSITGMSDNWTSDNRT